MTDLIKSNLKSHCCKEKPRASGGEWPCFSLSSVKLSVWFITKLQTLEIKGWVIDGCVAEKRRDGSEAKFLLHGCEPTNGSWQWISCAVCHLLIHTHTHTALYLYTYTWYCCSVAKSCPTAAPWTVARKAPWGSPDKNPRVGSHFLLQGIFLDQGLNPYCLHWQVDSLPLSHQRSPYIPV